MFLTNKQMDDPMTTNFEHCLKAVEIKKIIALFNTFKSTFLKINLITND